MEAATVAAATPSHPKGWEPGIELNGRQGFVSLPPLAEPAPDFDGYLRGLGFDPADFEILEPFHVRCWDANLGRNPATGEAEVRRMWYYRANIIRRRTDEAKLDASGLIEWIRSRPNPAKNIPSPDISGEAFVFAPSDLQLGKPDGDGTKGIIARYNQAVEDAERRIEELTVAGHHFGQVHLVSLADLTEGTSGQFPMQAYSAELNRRDQKRLATELLWHAIERLRPYASELHLSGVAGNHGEERQNGKAYTSFGDNDDLAVLDSIRMIADAVKAGVTCHIPTEELELVVDACGTKLGIAHGHQMDRGGGSPEQRVQRWWEHQVLGRNPIGEADILLTGHLHHLIVKELLGRWWMQAPSLEARSDWVRHTMGAPGSPGVLSFTTANGRWRDLQVLGVAA